MKHLLNGPKLLVKTLTYSYLTMVCMRCFILVSGIIFRGFLRIIFWVSLVGLAGLVMSNTSLKQKWPSRFIVDD